MTPVVAIFTAKPGHEDQLGELFKSVISTTLKEEGCITYQLNRDAKNFARYVWTELWESPQHLEKHLAAPHIKKLFSSVTEHVLNSEVLILEKLAGGNAS